MRRRILLIIGLTLATALPAGARTFTRSSIAAELGLDALTRSVARQQLGRDVFANPYATVTISNIDVYDRIPYVESRHFQVVSDPGWNRLVYGELGRSLSAYDGAGSALGPLSQPHGMAVDEMNHIYVADTGHDRILVFAAIAEFDRMSLVPRYAIDGLSGPYGVAYSDGGTPFVAGDDHLLVADTGRNRVVAYALTVSGAREVAALGGLGSGCGRFAGPMAVAVGRANASNTDDVYVADAHNRRIVRLKLEPGGLRWIAESPDGAGVVTSLDTDQWGNVFAAAPQQGMVRKFNAELEPVADLGGQIARPRDFHVPFATVRDHRYDTVRRIGQPNALSIDQWSDGSGVSLWGLGAAIDGLAVVGGETPAAHFTLTDQAAISLEVIDAADGRTLSRRALGTRSAGVQTIPLLPGDLRGATDGALVVRLSAASGYANAAPEVAQTSFRLDGRSVASPSQPVLLGSWPNPTSSSSRIDFVLPARTDGRITLGVFDAGGRRVRTLDRSFASGLNEVVWDGTDDGGRAVRSGLYFYRLDVGEQHLTRRLVIAR